jgi:toxin ParE1/3/4
LRYVVEITAPAQADIDAQVAYLQDEALTAERIIHWIERLQIAIASLQKMPERCPPIPEPLPARLPVRHLLVGPHRIVFAVDNSRAAVVIYRVFHGSRVLDSID